MTNYGNDNESSNIDLNSKDHEVLTMESLHSNVDNAKRWFGMKKIVGMKLALTSYRSPPLITSPTTETNYKK
jgi:hypothetical protein